MQLALDNRTETAEKKIVELESLGYCFRASQHRDGREVYLVRTTPGAIKNRRVSRLVKELEPYRKEVCGVLTDRARVHIKKCREMIRA